VIKYESAINDGQHNSVILTYLLEELIENNWDTYKTPLSRQ
jgi:hypothetical protein